MGAPSHHYLGLPCNFTQRRNPYACFSRHALWIRGLLGGAQLLHGPACPCRSALQQTSYSTSACLSDSACISTSVTSATQQQQVSRTSISSACFNTAEARQQHVDQLSLDQRVSKRQRPRPPTLGSKLFACSSWGLGTLSHDSWAVVVGKG